MRDISRFDQDVVLRARLLSIEAALSRLGLYWKVDQDFHPLKDSATKRLYVSIGNRVVELLVTNLKWYDVTAKKGGGGAIDLAMHLRTTDFVTAMKSLGCAEKGERACRVFE